jgi:hypothetical protein
VGTGFVEFFGLVEFVGFAELAKGDLVLGKSKGFYRNRDRYRNRKHDIDPDFDGERPRTR